MSNEPNSVPKVDNPIVRLRFPHSFEPLDISALSVVFIVSVFTSEKSRNPLFENYECICNAKVEKVFNRNCDQDCLDAGECTNQYIEYNNVAPCDSRVSIIFIKKGFFRVTR